MPRLPTLFLIVTASFFAGALAYGLRAQSQKGRDRDYARQAQDLLKDRGKLDDSVWAKEVVAQVYESLPIRLWDELRGAEDKWAVVEEAPFEELRVGKESGVRMLDGPVSVTKYAEAGKAKRSYTAYGPRDWKTFLKGCQKEGWNLIQGELHHKKFEGKGEADAKSVFSFVAHMERPEPRARRMVEGMMEVQWSAEKDASGFYKPRLIRVLEFSVKDREGPAAFTEVLGQAPEGSGGASNDAAPLLIHDLDRDGDAEVILPRYNLVYWNEGEGSFRKGRLLRNFSEKDEASVSAALLADFNGDGMDDLFLSRVGLPPLLFAGKGKGEFQDEPSEVQIPGALWHSSLALAAGDLDGDKDLDIWLTQYKIPYGEGHIPVPYYDANDSEPAYLLINRGDGSFDDGTESSGLAPKRYRRTYSSSFVDLDDDGDLDLAESSDFAGVDLFENDGHGHFKDVSNAADQVHTFGMGQAFGDFNGDGLLDIYAVGMGSTTAYRLEFMGLGRPEFPEVQKMRTIMGYGNRMLMGQGPGGGLGAGHRLYMQAPWNDKVSRTGWSWGVAELDYDLDGDQDLFVANGHSSGSTARDYCTTFWTQDIYPCPNVPPKARDWALSQSVAPLREGRVSWNPFEHKFLLNNLPGPKALPGQPAPPERDFVNIGFLMDLGFEFDGRCVAVEDLNLDGRPDLVLTEEPLNKPGRVHILMNSLPPLGHWLGVRVRDGKDRSSLGARITISVHGRRQTLVVTAGDSFRTQQSSQKIFGLGKTRRVDWVEVKRVNEEPQRLVHPAADQYHDF